MGPSVLAVHEMAADSIQSLGCNPCSNVLQLWRLGRSQAIIIAKLSCNLRLAEGRSAGSEHQSAVTSLKELADKAAECSRFFTGKMENMYKCVGQEA